MAKWGNSLAVRIPRRVAEEAGLDEGAALDISVERRAIVLRRRVGSLDELVGRITPENRHAETDTGTPRGNEAW
ncbi:MAG: AbrB/MazE/SpoVT family DNA-binding domain-containing protein [Alphaproteobacteria bacterium]